MKSALLHEGFAVLEILSQCPTHFGRYGLNTGDPRKVLDWMRSISVMIGKVKNMDNEELEGKTILGEFVNKTRPIFRGSSVYRGEGTIVLYPLSIRLCGYGGQGIILASIILGEVMVKKKGLYAVQTQSYGSEARGGQCQAELIVSDKPIQTPISEKNDIIIALFQTAFDAYVTRLEKNGLLLLTANLFRNLPI
ncbi:MAG: 2-oxoacid:acceptor oxidoreductase family protein [Acetomicrobium sp.]